MDRLGEAKLYRRTPLALDVQPRPACDVLAKVEDVDPGLRLRIRTGRNVSTTRIGGVVSATSRWLGAET